MEQVNNTQVEFEQRTNNKIMELEKRIEFMETFLLRQFGTHISQEPGYKEIQSDAKRTESGMGPILSSNSNFL